MQKRVKWGKREKTESKKTGGNVRNDRNCHKNFPQPRKPPKWTPN